MSIEGDLLWDSAEDLFEDAPCGYVSTDLDGTFLRVNRTFENWIGIGRAELLDRRRFQDLLAPGARIYHETHFLPLLRMQGFVREIAVEIIRADGSRLSALINSVMCRDDAGTPRLIRTTIFDATDRRRYEQELLRGRQREREIAHELQRSLLSGDLPATPRLELEVVYEPGVSGLEVGGDWYDVFWLEDGDTVGLVVGDVVGRGLEAAASMGQLRSAVRALASTGLSPNALLEALDRYAHRHSVGQMATVIYAQLSLDSRWLRFACAGHPPPLVAAPGEEPHFLWEGRSLPLDTHLGSGKRHEAAMRLKPKSTVLLYTDGLIERRGVPLNEGMDRLLTEVSAHRHEAAHRLAANIVRALHDAEHTDDTCLLIASLGAS